MSTISYVALQCYACSTMQVKQKKKSSNKWNCVVCNEKQSVRKVFYEAFLAKDVRLFVQDFNMSRKFDDQDTKQTLIEAATSSHDNESSQNNGNGCLAKRRNDWSEYLDPEIESNWEDGQEKGCELEPEFVTELPKEIFKRPKLKNHSLGLRSSGAVKSSNPVSSSEKTGIPISTKGPTGLRSNEVTYKDIFEKNVSKPKMAFQTETTNLRSDEATYNKFFEKNINKPEMTYQAESTKGTSKWAEYLTEEDEDNDYLFKDRNEKSTEIPSQNWRENPFEMQCNDQKVEEDLHPDFF